MSQEAISLRQADANFGVAGILSEKKLEKMKDAEGKNIIRGSLVVKVDDTNFVTLNVYTGEFTNKGDLNKAYSGMETVMDEYVSIAEVGEEEADIIRCRKGNLQPNSYIGKEDGLLHVGVRYSASFVNRVRKEEFEPYAEFDVEGFIYSMVDEMNKEAEPTGRLKINLYVPTYKGVEPLELIADEYASDCSDMFDVGQTVKFYGEIQNRTIVKEKVIKHAIGKERIETTREYVNELIITNADPIEENLAFSTEAIKAALVERDMRLENEKRKRLNEKKKGAVNKTPAANGGRPLPKFNL